MKRSKKAFLSSAVASVALVGSLGIASLASAASDFSGFPTLSLGSSGGYVRALQANLWCYGQSGSVGTIDGSFGSGTKTGLMSFQSSKGLSADGVAGSATWNTMNYSVTVEIPNTYFYLWTADSTTYWADYTTSSSNHLTYNVKYKSNNSVVTSGTVY
ncbi:Zinc D-Ala-D-Ala carboxypeptidase precursor [compost metagenome]